MKASSVLIVYNQPNSTEDQPEFHPESVSGVLDEVQAVEDALRKLHIGFRTVPLDSFWELPLVLSQSPEHIVFNLVEGFSDFSGYENEVPAVIFAFGKIFTGNSTKTMHLTSDKWITNVILKQAGLNVPKGFLIEQGYSKIPEISQGRYIVKPCRTDASEGLEFIDTAVNGISRLEEVAQKIHKQYSQPALVEEYIHGREYNVSILRTDQGPEVLPIAEIDFSAFAENEAHVVDYAAKWIPDSFQYCHTPRIIPVSLDKETERKIREAALIAWTTAGCSSYARIDMRIDTQGHLFVLEINANPDISPEGGFIAAIKASGKTYEDFVRIMVTKKLPVKKPSEISEMAQMESKCNITEDKISIRLAIPKDVNPIIQILKETSFFRPTDVMVAEEVLRESVKRGATTYQSYTACNGDEVIGWICFGLTPCTVCTFDIYWLAVKAEIQRLGIGRKLLQHAESMIKRLGGRLCIVETSGSERYSPTKMFYEKNGYRENANIPDFYSPNDSKVIYVKEIK